MYASTINKRHTSTLVHAQPGHQACEACRMPLSGSVRPRPSFAGSQGQGFGPRPSGYLKRYVWDHESQGFKDTSQRVQVPLW